jgi:hypothetical protein
LALDKICCSASIAASAATCCSASDEITAGSFFLEGDSVRIQK